MCGYAELLSIERPEMRVFTLYCPVCVLSGHDSRVRLDGTGLLCCATERNRRGEFRTSGLTLGKHAQCTVLVCMYVYTVLRLGVTIPEAKSAGTRPVHTAIIEHVGRADNTVAPRYDNERKQNRENAAPTAPSTSVTAQPLPARGAFIQRKDSVVLPFLSPLSFPARLRFSAFCHLAVT